MCDGNTWILREGLVRRAESVIGWRELPGNMGTLLDEDLDGKPWCARLIRRLFELCGHPIYAATRRDRDLLLWVEWMEQTFRKHHHWRDVASDYQPRKGDVVFWRGRDASDPGKGRHVSLLVSVSHEDKTLEVISGNWRNAVARHRVFWSPAVLTGFGWVL
jgi:hypothetical protein